MTDTPRIVTLVIAACFAAGCGKSEAPPAAAKAEAPKEAAAPAAAEKPRLVMPDACALLDAGEVAKAAGWSSANAVKANTNAVYLARCDFVDAADKTRVVKVEIAYGALIPDDSANYAEIVGDLEGRLKKPATPVTTFGIPVIEMDGGTGVQSMQTRFEPTTELTVTTPTMQTTRVLFPRALITLRKLPELQIRNDS
jgi:hypothetical protein